VRPCNICFWSIYGSDKGVCLFCGVRYCNYIVIKNRRLQSTNTIINIPIRNLKLYIVYIFQWATGKEFFPLNPPNPVVLKVCLDPLNSRLEWTFLASLYFGITQISTDSKSMRASFKIFPLVSWCELFKDLIRYSRWLGWKLLINSASVDKERSFWNGGVFLGVLR
jgi:hypothetical protein